MDLALDLMSWPRGTHIQSAADIPPETMAALGMTFGPIVAGFAVVSVWFSSQCPMTRQGHEAVVAELNRRRSEAALAPGP